VRTRRYHALLLAAVTPPTGRFVLVNGLDAFVETAAGRFALSGQRYAGDVVHPDGPLRVESFRSEPWPRWTYRLGDDTRVEQEVFVTHERPQVVVCWRLVGHAQGEARLEVKPFLSGRDYHSLHHENAGFDFRPELAEDGRRLVWRPYPGLPGVVARSNGRYAHEPLWYRSFLYAEEQERGLDCVEDLAAPGSFHFDLARGEAVLVLAADLPDASQEAAPDALALAAALRAREQRRRARSADPLERAADAYLVRRGEGRTIVAGYPWFTDWGRDTFIAVRGLCFATGRFDDAKAILVEWAGAVSDGMLPNRFPDRAEPPEYNSVDASLFYVVAVHELLRAASAGRARVARRERERLVAAVAAILDGHRRGTRHGIRRDADGLLAAGEPGVQLTWMDAKIGDRVITPRIGKPVEIQALWLNALRIGAGLEVASADEWERGRAAFRERFWSDATGALADVVDVDHVPGRVDLSFRPNQVLAVGGLPFPVLDGERARRVVDAVEARLMTPLGLRSIAPDEAGYRPRYGGGVVERDEAYHQGTVWPWLLGPFVEAWVRVRGGTPQAKRDARERFVAPLRQHLGAAGLGHVSEVADGDVPHRPGGCPFQAWSLGELLRIERQVLAERETERPARAARAGRQPDLPRLRRFPDFDPGSRRPSGSPGSRIRIRTGPRAAARSSVTSAGVQALNG
jgi:predicted glycogen debranching enzyme